MTHPYTDLKEAAERATVGPWDGSHSYASVTGPEGEVADVVDGSGSYRDIDFVQARANAAFIALARNRLPALIADYERMREALKWYANPEVYKPHPNGLAFDRRDLSYHASAALKEKPHD